MTTAREYFENEVWDLPLAERRAALSRVVAMADAEGDVDTGFEARIKLIQANHANPNRLEQVAAYGWCLARHDEDPDRFPINLWYYKWIPGAVVGSPEVSREQIDSLLEDLASRFDSGAQESAPVVKLRMRAALDLGDIERAAELFDVWRERLEERRGRLNDCSACDAASHASTLAQLGRYSEALAAAEGLTDGRSRCSSQPHYALGTALHSARAEGRWHDAARWHRRGLDLIEGNSDFDDALSHHLRHLAIAACVDARADLDIDSGIPDALDRAIRLASSAIVTLEGDEEHRYFFYRGVRLVLAAADAVGYADTSGALGELRDAVAGRAEALAAAFDARNGNAHFGAGLHRDDLELAVCRP